MKLGWRGKPQSPELKIFIQKNKPIPGKDLQTSTENVIWTSTALLWSPPGHSGLLSSLKKLSC